MPYTTGTRHPQALSRLAQEALPLLYQHRLLTTHQLHQLVQPAARHPVYLRTQLRALRERGLAGSVLRTRGGGQGQLVWYCTPAGCEVVEASGEVARRAYRMSEQAARNALQEHTLAVNDVGLAFVAAARRAGPDHACGPLDWEPERAHRLRDGGDGAIVPDAVLSYVHHAGGRRRILSYFVEVDRATESPLTLARKVRDYARYLDYVPLPPPGRGRAGRSREAWRDRYPAFPRVLIVLTGASPRVLARRAADLRALASADAVVRQTTGRMLVGATRLQHLHEHGPWEPIVTPVLGDPALTNALMEPAPGEEGGPDSEIQSEESSGICGQTKAVDITGPTNPYRTAASPP